LIKLLQNVIAYFLATRYSLMHIYSNNIQYRKDKKKFWAGNCQQEESEHMTSKHENPKMSLTCTCCSQMIAGGFLKLG